MCIRDRSNPTYDKAQEGAALVKEKGVDFILAVGGRQRSGLLQGHILSLIHI